MVSAVVGKTMPEPLKIVGKHGFIEIQKCARSARLYFEEQLDDRGNMLLSEFPRLSPWIEFGRIGKVRSLCVDTSGVAISLAWYFRQYAVRTRALVNDKEDYNMYFTKRLTWKVGALRFRNTGIFFEYICTNFCYSNIHDGSNDYVIFPSNKKQNWRDITENTHGDYYISLAPNTPREISIDDHSTPRYNLKIFYRIYRIIIIRGKR